MIHAKQNRHCFSFAPFFVLIPALVKVSLSVLHKLQNALVVIERKYQNLVIVFPGGNVVSLCNLRRNTTAFQIFNGLRLRFDFLLWQLAVFLLRIIFQPEAKITSQFYKVTMISTGRTKALKSTVFQIYGKCVLISACTASALWATLEKQFVSLFLDFRTDEIAKVKNI